MLLFICLLCDIRCHLTICSAEECPYDTKQICTRTYAVFFNIFDGSSVATFSDGLASVSSVVSRLFGLLLVFVSGLA